jgi:hypothetical protein
MEFKLVAPWVEWRVRTIIARRAVLAKVDTGAAFTLLGVANAELLGLTVEFIRKQPCVRFRGIVGTMIGYAFKVPCSYVPLGSENLPTSYIYVPYTYVKEERDVVNPSSLKFKFISEGAYLLGTDILNNYNMRINFNKKIHNTDVMSVQFELIEHGLSIAKSDIKAYTFQTLAPKIEDLNIESDLLGVGTDYIYIDPVDT